MCSPRLFRVIVHVRVLGGGRSRQFGAQLRELLGDKLKLSEDDVAQGTLAFRRAVGGLHVVGVG